MKDLKLSEMLTYRRPAGSNAEIAFIERYLIPVPGMEVDTYGNHFVVVGEGSRTLFSCHTDTVHRSSGRQKVSIDPTLNHAFVTEPESNCLGADDTAGCYIMLRMIYAGVPGTYVFHRDEEIGGGGSDHFAKSVSVGDYNYCIAFDRKGYGDVITHQAGGRCCSDDFAEALCDALGDAYLPDNGGTFTDSANYIHVIPECTNISVGYFNAHTAKEWLDLGFVERLAKVCCDIEWELLPVKRKAEHNSYYGMGGMYGGRDWNGGSGWTSGKSVSEKELSYEQLLKIVEMEPGLAAEMLYQMRATQDDFDAAIEDYYTTVAEEPHSGIIDEIPPVLEFDFDSPTEEYLGHGFFPDEDDVENQDTFSEVVITYNGGK